MNREGFCSCTFFTASVTLLPFLLLRVLLNQCHLLQQVFVAFAVPPSKDLTAAERLRLKASSSHHHQHHQHQQHHHQHDDDDHGSSAHGHSSHTGRGSHRSPSPPSKRDKKPPQFAAGAGCDRLELPRLLAEVSRLVPGACPDVAGLIALQVIYFHFEGDIFLYQKSLSTLFIRF